MNEQYEPQQSMGTPQPVGDGVSPKIPEKKPKTHSTRKVVLIALCVSLLGSIVGTTTALLVGKNLEQTAQQEAVLVLKGHRENSVIEEVPVESKEPMTAAEVYKANVNSTVGITTSITTNFWGFQSTSAASGSGFIISPDGYILTNYHVVEDSDSITVSLYDGTAYEAALIGYDASNDIAVLKVDAEDLVPVVLGDSDNLNVGDDVVAIGNPLGELTFTLTAGKISAKDREVTLSNAVTMNLLQTDCAINSGNSGGALFNMYGEVIGITNAKYSSSSTSEASIDNIGFAIPLNGVWGIIEDIIEKGYIAKPYVGISVANVSPEAQNYGVPQGAAVQAVAEDSPAQKAGLQVGDVITKIDETEVTSSSELVDYITGCAKGDTIKLSVYRQGSTIQITIEVGEQIQAALLEEEKTAQEQSAPQQMPGLFPWGGFFGGW